MAKEKNNIKKTWSGTLCVYIGPTLQKKWSEFCTPPNKPRVNLVSNLVSAALSEYMLRYASEDKK